MSFSNQLLVKVKDDLSVNLVFMKKRLVSFPSVSTHGERKKYNNKIILEYPGSYTKLFWKSKMNIS